MYGELRALAEEVLAEMGASERLPGLSALDPSEEPEVLEAEPEKYSGTSIRKAEAFQRLRETDSAAREKTWTEEFLGVFFRR